MNSQIFACIYILVFVIGFPIGHLFSSLADYFQLKASFLRAEFYERYPEKRKKSFFSRLRRKRDE